MTSISASTVHKIKGSGAPSVSVLGKTKTKKSSRIKSVARKTGKGKVGATKAGVAPKLKPSLLSTEESIRNLTALDDSDQRAQITSLSRSMLGIKDNFSFSGNRLTKPHTGASTFMERASSAADLAVATKHLGVYKVLKTYGVLAEIERNLVPRGMGFVFENLDKEGGGYGMKRIISVASLQSMGSMDDTTTISASTNHTDKKDKGKYTPSNAREGCMLFMRALCEIVGKQSAPFVVPFLGPVLDEIWSSPVRETAEDTCKAIIKSASPFAVESLIIPVLFAAIDNSPEWRVKQAALDCLTFLSSCFPTQVSNLLPAIIPIASQQVWDTKPQVTKSAQSCLLAICQTNINPDVKPAIPAIVSAIAKPSETVKAVEELMSTTFIAEVDASTLAILCPILSRGLREKMAQDKRKCCVVIQNMSKLVHSPQAVAPFGPLLVPDLKKVATNVQFEDIRDAALAALKTLTKALGHMSVEDALESMKMREETKRVEDEEKMIEIERAEEKRREEENARKEEIERRQWKEAMEAQRVLDKLAEEEEEKKKKEFALKSEIQKSKTKGQGGKCKACGLKKCKKTCLFA